MRILSPKLILTYIAIVFSIWGCSELADDVAGPQIDVVTYSNDVKPILDRSCVRCHGSVVSMMGLNLSSYESIQNVVGTDVSSDLIVPGNLNSIILKRKLNPDKNMYIYLNDPFEYDIIYQWIVDDDLAP